MAEAIVKQVNRASQKTRVKESEIAENTVASKNDLQAGYGDLSYRA